MAPGEGSGGRGDGGREGPRASGQRRAPGRAPRPGAGGLCARSGAPVAALALAGPARPPHRDVAVQREQRRRRRRHQELAVQLVQLPADDAEPLVVLVEDGRQELQLGLQP